jgi:hypothetical protein
MLAELSSWMDEHSYSDIASFRGKLAQQKTSNLWSFARGQYIQAVVGVE